MVETTAAHLSLRQQKITLANRPSPGQPITTNPEYVDQAALDLHGKSVEFKAKSANLGDYLAGAPTVTILDAV
jgi:hypothetical protein